MQNMTEKPTHSETNFRQKGTSAETAMRIPGQRNPDRTRRAILDAATDEFVDKGFAGASVNEIAERAQVNKRMLYHYFGKKDELYIAVLERVYTSLRAAQTETLQLAALSPQQAIEELVVFTWNYYLKNPDFLRLMSIENMQQGRFALRSERISGSNGPFQDLMNDVLRRGQKEGVFRQDADPFQLYLTIAALGSFHIATRFTLSGLTGCDQTTEEALNARVQHIIDVVLGYLRP